jgi:hypothetical protein
MGEVGRNGHRRGDMRRIGISARGRGTEETATVECYRNSVSEQLADLRLPSASLASIVYASSVYACGLNRLARRFEGRQDMNALTVLGRLLFVESVAQECGFLSLRLTLRHRLRYRYLSRVRRRKRQAWFWLLEVASSVGGAQQKKPCFELEGFLPVSICAMEP